MRGTTTTAAALLDAWQWEIPNHPPAMLTADEEAILDATIEEVQRSPASCAVAHGGRTAVWRYLEAARWQPEVSGKPVSTYFLETLEWRESLGVDSILDCDENTINSLLPETRSGGMFVRGTCLLGRSLIWIHLGRKRVEEPESNLRFLIYTVVSIQSATTHGGRFESRRWCSSTEETSLSLWKGLEVLLSQFLATALCSCKDKIVLNRWILIGYTFPR